MTITLDKGDILGLLLLLAPGVYAMAMLWGVVMSIMTVGWPKIYQWIWVLVFLGALSLIGWGLWELAHWFTRA